MIHGVGYDRFVVDTVAGYRLEALLGRGSTGTVWLARRDGPVDHWVAIKRVAAGDAAAIAELRREARVLASLDHPHVVAILDLIDDPSGLALVMAHARGGSLRALIDERGTLAPGEAVAVLAPVADALASAHRCGVVHGDVKPANILFTSDGEPLLADFGVARHLGAPAVAHLPVRGTAGYIDPAVVGGGAPTGASDVYGLAVVAYEALSGRRPHRGGGAEVLAAAASGAHEPLGQRRSVPAGLAAVVDAALALDPSCRPSATELAVALRHAVDRTELHLPGPAIRHVVEVDDGRTRTFGPQPSRPSAAGRSSKRWPAIAVSAVVAVLVVAIAWWVPRDATSADDDRDGVAAADAAPDRAPAIRCPAVEPPPPTARGDQGAELPTTDLDGDRCPDRATLDGRVLLARLSMNADRPRAFRVGELGDQVVIGDWDCDGVASPAVYRPDTGEVLFAPHLATRVGDRVHADRVEQRARGGRSERVVLPGGCDQVRVVLGRRNGDDGR